MSRFVAITRVPSPSLAGCELSFVARTAIDVDLAIAQHRDYERALELLGCRVIALPALEEQPDAVFVEDVALVLDEAAVMTRPGAESRRAEGASIATVLADFRPLLRIEAPGTLDGGDVLQMGRRLFVGRSHRTNDEGIGQLRAIAERVGWMVHPVPIEHYLHLKSAVTAVAADTLLIDPRAVPVDIFEGYRLIETDPREVSAANALLAHDTVIYPDAFPGTAERLCAAGIRLQLLDVSEVAKAEGGVTCCCILIA